jgi:hypothetical protein
MPPNSTNNMNASYHFNESHDPVNHYASAITQRKPITKTYHGASAAMARKNPNNAVMIILLVDRLILVQLLPVDPPTLGWIDSATPLGRYP